MYTHDTGVAHAKVSVHCHCNQTVPGKSIMPGSHRPRLSIVSVLPANSPRPWIAVPKRHELSSLDILGNQILPYRSRDYRGREGLRFPYALIDITVPHT